jgi:hypothetical protein
VSSRLFLAAAGILIVAGCNKSSSDRPFDLVCDSTDTLESSTLHCVRIDTRDGDTRRVLLNSIPRAQGPTRSAPEAPGTYQLVCNSTDTPQRSDFRCVRLNRRTGELLIVAEQLLPTIPEGIPGQDLATETPGHAERPGQRMPAQPGPPTPGPSMPGQSGQTVPGRPMPAGQPVMAGPPLLSVPKPPSPPTHP